MNQLGKIDLLQGLLDEVREPFFQLSCLMLEKCTTSSINLIYILKPLGFEHAHAAAPAAAYICARIEGGRGRLKSCSFSIKPSNRNRIINLLLRCYLFFVVKK
jgi:hypothetical protein